MFIVAYATTERVGNGRVEYELIKHEATIPVVFENGMTAKFVQWDKVFRDISKDTTAFAYNRPGYGNSEPVATPRNGNHVVDELRSVLRSKGLNPPYILVGHSLGGLYMQFFARRYPEEVRAIVLVDSTHPAQFKGPGALENWPVLIRVGFKLFTSAVERDEFNAINSTGENVLALPAFSGKPVIVLSASRPLEAKSEVADDSNAKRRDVARLYPGSQQIWVDSGHNIPTERPEAIVGAIRALIGAGPDSE